jgi:hypothetical protein
MKKQILTIIGVLLAAMLLLPIDPSTTWEPLRLFNTNGFHGYLGRLNTAELSLFIWQTVFVCLLAVFIVNVPSRSRMVLLSLIAVAALTGGVVWGVVHTMSLRTAAREEARQAAAKAEIHARLNAKATKGIPFDSDDIDAYLAAEGTPEELDAWLAKHSIDAVGQATPTP